MKLKKASIVSILIGLGVFSSALPAHSMGILKSKVLEKEYALNFECIYPVAGDTNQIRIKGLAGDSALCVKKMDTNASDKNMTIYIYLSLVSGESGSFDFTINIPESIDRIYFGKNKEIIWERTVSNYRLHPIADSARSE